ncbi:copper chaperone PCu(A)C [Marinomonas atlantica]|uniref:copper chaperone PCu(A)C n=1 Tax=Marinomonas atlantica TaxID=1806668 RepID=UPI000834E35E|nr:copper chaperone PCu(A)C [Marinomonas atlantica]MCO4787129.1 copper chaperone PCu(A)C [Marinomonas atlantica]
MPVKQFISSVVLLATASASSLALASTIELSDPAVRAMPPGAPASGAYVTLTNHSDQERFLVDVESDAADTVEIHISKMEGDTMVMARVPHIAVPAHGQAMLKPGGYHIMMIGLAKPFKAGDQVKFTLVMKNGERIPMQAPVMSPEQMASYMPAGMSMKHMDHSTMKHDDMKSHEGHEMKDKDEHSAHH